MFDANSIINVACGASVDPRPAYLPWNPVNPRAAQVHIRDNFLCRRRQENFWSHYNRRNTLVNHWVNCQDKNRNGPVTQYFLFGIPVASVIKCLISVDSVSNCLCIVCNITFCVTHSFCV